MARLTDTVIREKYLTALSEWDSGYGGISWEDHAADWLNRHLPKSSQRRVGEIMYRHVLEGGDIHQIPERREGWKDIHEYHYDLQIEIQGRLRYIETRLIEESRVHDPYIAVVNMHDAR